MPDARSEFDQHLTTVQEYAGLNLSESDTRAYLVDPLLRLLGFADVKHLRREVTVPATKEFLDYELLVDGQPQVIVEAKALRHSLSDRHAAQCVQYASVLGVRWCLITNGLAWALYDAHATGPLREKRVAEVRLDGDETAGEEAWAVLSAFSRHALAQSNPITSLLVDRVVADELSRADSTAVRALRRSVQQRFGERVSTEAVVSAIERVLRASAPAAEAGAEEPGAQIATEPEPPTTPRPRRTKGGGRRVTIAELVAAGLLPPDATLEATVSGVTHIGRLREGQLEVNGVTYGTPSAASAAIRSRKSWNGWVDWRYRGATLAALRQRLPSVSAAESEPG